MTRVRRSPTPDHRSDRRSMIYFLVDQDGTMCKIGVASDVRSRVKQHITSYPWRFYAAIFGSQTNEAQIHEHFRALAWDGRREHYHLKGELADYLEWLGTRAWAATSLDSLDDAYEFAGRFPWSPRDSSTDPQLTLGLADQIVPGLRKPLNRSARILATIRSESDEWYTPTIYVDAARRVMGGIDLDPASSPLANLTVRADAIYTKQDDGLRYQWPGRVWLNPPYGNEKDRFVEHLLSEWRAGRCEQAVMCLNAHATDTVWFQQLWEFPICFTHHRPRFIGGQKDKTADETTPTTGIAFVYVGPAREQFADEFRQFGPVVMDVRAASVSASEFRRRQANGIDWEGAA